MLKFCSLFSGSSGNCLFIKNKDTSILIDAGVSGKRILASIEEIGENPSEIKGILVSHEHTDHCKGVGILSRKFDIPVYANIPTWEAMKDEIGEVKTHNIRDFKHDENFFINNIEIRSFLIPHDAACPSGFSVFSQECKITVATDIGHMTNQLLENFEGSDLLFLESNHDIEMLKVGPYPYSLKQRILGRDGHLSNEMAGKTIAYMAQRGTKKFILGHLSKENNFPELVYETACNYLREKEICPENDIFLEVAKRDAVGKIIEICRAPVAI